MDNNTANNETWKVIRFTPVSEFSEGDGYTKHEAIALIAYFGKRHIDNGGTVTDFSQTGFQYGDGCGYYTIPE